MSPRESGNPNPLSLGQSLHFLTRMTFRPRNSALGPASPLLRNVASNPHPSSALPAVPGASPGGGDVLSFSAWGGWRVPPRGPSRQGHPPCWPVSSDQWSGTGTTQGRAADGKAVSQSSPSKQSLGVGCATFEATAHSGWHSLYLLHSAVLLSAQIHFLKQTVVKDSLVNYPPLSPTRLRTQ